MAMDLSVRMGKIKTSEMVRIIDLLKQAGLPVRPPAGMTPEMFLTHMAVDKKVKKGRVRLVLLNALGDAYLSDDYSTAQLNLSLARFCQ